MQLAQYLQMSTAISNITMQVIAITNQHPKPTDDEIEETVIEIVVNGIIPILNAAGIKLDPNTTQKVADKLLAASQLSSAVGAMSNPSAIQSPSYGAVIR